MNRDFSLIDANINRAEEGVRVVEDACRFVLREPNLWAKLKEVRHALQEVGQNFGWASTLSGRQEYDFGIEKVVAGEYVRGTLAGIIQANIARSTQSIRALEEFAKIYNQELSHKLENLRYDLYVLEYKTLILTPHYWLNKYFEQGVIYPISDSVEELVWLINHGAKIFQLRDKKSSRKEIYQKAKYLCKYIESINSNRFPSLDKEGRTASDAAGEVEGHSTPPDLPLSKGRNQTNKDKILFILNDDVEMASKLPVAGVHIGQDDAIIQDVRKIIGSNKIIGRSNHSMEQIRQSAKDGADCCSIGPIFATPTKAGRPAVGLEIISDVAKEIHIPWLAIGGVDQESIKEMKKRGAKNFAVVRSAKSFFE